MIILQLYLYLFQVYGQTDNGQYTVLFWEPIDASVLELRIDRYHLTSACVGIKLYGCVSSEGKYHCVCLYKSVRSFSDLCFQPYILYLVSFSLCVCVYMCACICMYACVAGVCACACYVCVHACVYVCMYMYVYVSVYVCVYSMYVHGCTLYACLCVL